MRNLLRSVLVALGLVALQHTALAQGYPDQPIRLIVPWPPGGGADIVARLVASKLKDGLGQPIIVDNRAGASGNIGALIGAESAPDGYTMIFAYSGTHSINPHLYKKMPFKQSDFAPVILLTSVPQIVVVNSAVPAKSISELITLAKSQPGVLTFGSSGNGAMNHLTGELFSKLAGVKLLHVPYRGGGPLSIALMSNEVNMIFGEPGTVMEQIKAGRLRALAVTSATRTVTAPELPTIAESGVPGYDVTSWNGMLVPAGTPQAIIARLNLELNKVLAMPDIRKALLDRGYEPAGGEPEKFGQHMQSELDKWGPVVRDIGLQID